MNVFESHARRYDEWYDRNREIYERELFTIPKPSSPSLEIGVGTGRFASALGIDVGVDISLAMLKIAKSRNVESLLADGRKLPFRNNIFKSVYLIFTLCFLDSPTEVLAEAKRVLRKDGFMVVCIIPKNSGLGKEYSFRESPFYRIAIFYTEDEAISMLRRAGFKVMEIRKTFLVHSENDFVCLIAKPQ
ncbi:class I SAM-dependent methyltransferase [Archaeoglobus neptunius]|uniref:class I SAM-dependent methyltransferase n=1 Tax=Archaeoglobus neptunius TaxID=2798580 RepID=UPI00192860ED